MSKPVWNKGAPPSIGWWPASLHKDQETIRWWDGKNWSTIAFSNWTAKQAATSASLNSPFNKSEIYWAKRWWL